MDRERESWHKHDYYAILGVTIGCSTTDVNRCFREVASTCRPDEVPPGEWESATKKFQLIAEAYEVLSRDDSRQQYEQVRTNIVVESAQSQSAVTAPAARRRSLVLQNSQSQSSLSAPVVRRRSLVLQNAPSQSDLASPVSSRRSFSWPAWCLEETPPGIEVLVYKADDIRWVKAKPQERVVDPRTGEDAYINASYFWNGREYIEDFGPDRVRRCGDLQNVTNWLGGPLGKIDILTTIGFKRSQAKDAIVRCSSVDASVYYLMSNSAAAQGAVDALARVLARRNATIVFL